MGGMRNRDASEVLKVWKLSKVCQILEVCEVWIYGRYGGIRGMGCIRHKDVWSPFFLLHHSRATSPGLGTIRHWVLSDIVYYQMLGTIRRWVLSDIG